jgi:hypothetical protein
MIHNSRLTPLTKTPFELRYRLELFSPKIIQPVQRTKDASLRQMSHGAENAIGSQPLLMLLFFPRLT